MLSRNSGWGARAKKLFATAVIGAAAASGMTGGMIAQAHADTSFLNVSYDPTRELYQEFNQAFGKKWKAETGETVTFKHPFHIRGIAQELPAGPYEVVTDEEMIDGLSFAVWRRVATMITVPSEGVRGATEMRSIGSVDLANAQRSDANH